MSFGTRNRAAAAGGPSAPRPPHAQKERNQSAGAHRDPDPLSKQSRHMAADPFADRQKE
jgi:hypothetical protein